MLKIENVILVISVNYQINTIILIIVLLVKKPIDVDFSALTTDIQSSHKTSKAIVGDTARITKYSDTFTKDITGNWSREIFVTDFVLKNPWT